MLLFERDSYCCGAGELLNFVHGPQSILDPETQKVKPHTVEEEYHEQLLQLRRHLIYEKSQNKRFVTCYLAADQITFNHKMLIDNHFKEVVKGTNPNSGNLIALYVCDLEDIPEWTEEEMLPPGKKPLSQCSVFTPSNPESPMYTPPKMGDPKYPPKRRMSARMGTTWV